MTCPDPECHKRLEGMASTLYGSDGTGGVVGCLKEKVPKKWIWIIVLAFGLPALAFGANLWHKSNSRELEFAQKEVVNDHEVRLRVQENRYEEIIETMKQLKRNQEEMRKDIRKLLIRNRIE